MKKPNQKEMNGKQTLAAAKYSLSIGDHMNIDIGWLIEEIERLKKENFRLKRIVNGEGWGNNKRAVALQGN